MCTPSLMTSFRISCEHWVHIVTTMVQLIRAFNSYPLVRPTRITLTILVKPHYYHIILVQPGINTGYNMHEVIYRAYNQGHVFYWFLDKIISIHDFCVKMWLGLWKLSMWAQITLSYIFANVFLSKRSIPIL